MLFEIAFLYLKEYSRKCFCIPRSLNNVLLYVEVSHTMDVNSVPFQSSSILTVYQKTELDGKRV